MKTVILLSMILASAVSFAGPDDHIQNQVCYTIAAENQAKAAAELPLELCFESVQLHLTQLNSNLPADSIEVYSYFSHYSNYLKNLKLTSYIRETEDEFTFNSSAVLVDREEQHCEDSVKITLDFNGRASAINGVADLGTQELTLTQITKADVCHSNFEKNVFNYVRTR